MDARRTRVRFSSHENALYTSPSVCERKRASPSNPHARFVLQKNACLRRSFPLPKRTEAWTQGALVSVFLRTKTLYTRPHLCVNASARLREMSHARVLPNACLCLCEPRAPCRVTHIRVRAHACLRHKDKKVRAATESNVCSSF